MFTRNNAFNDQTWRSVTLMTWTDVESSVYLIAACLPSLRPLMRAIAHQKVFKKQYWSKDIQPTSDEHVHSKSNVKEPFGGANGFRRLHGEHGDDSEAERGQHSIQKISRGGIDEDEGIELAQIIKTGQIRVTNAVQVDFETIKAHTHGQRIANNQ